MFRKLKESFFIAKCRDSWWDQLKEEYKAVAKENPIESVQKESPEKLLLDLQELIERGRHQAVASVNSAMTLTYWHVGKRINEEVLQGERAEYGKQIVVSLSKELAKEYGRSFESKNLRRMMQFAELFTDLEIVVPLARQLSWSHFLTIIPLKSQPECSMQE